MFTLNIYSVTERMTYGSPPPAAQTNLAFSSDNLVTRSKLDSLKTEYKWGVYNQRSAVQSKFGTKVDIFEKPQMVTGLDPQESREIQALKQRDAEVKQHEQAHLAAAGSYARSGPIYEYKIGPDGQRYAVGGEVQIDTSPIPDDPEATIRKAKVIQKAALAPAEPSSQDRQVAAQAEQMERKARQELTTQAEEEGQRYYRNGQPTPAKPKSVILNLII